MTRSDVLLTLMSGAIITGYSVCALFFLRFWRTTRDRLFVVFSAAFWLLALQRFALGLIEPLEEWRTGLYVLRLLAFLLILGAIIDKNRTREDGAAQPGGRKQ
jgi:hypothetical protein